MEENDEISNFHFWKQLGCPNQPRIDFSYYKYVPRLICLLICGIKPTLKIGLAMDVGHPCTFQPNLGEYHASKTHWSEYKLIQLWLKDTFEVQYFQHIAPIRTSQQLFDLFGIHPKETVPSALVHRKFPYTVGSSSLEIVERSLVHLKRVKIAGKSMSEALIFASTNPQYDNRLSIELPVLTWKLQAQNMRRTCCLQKLFFVFVLTFKTIYVSNMFSTCSELGIFM